MSRKSKAALQEWIKARRAEGYWVSVCLSCGTWFAQSRRGRKGVLCGLRRCELWRAYQEKIGRAPPAWKVAKWLAEHGDRPSPKYITPLPRWRCGIQEAA